MWKLHNRIGNLVHESVPRSNDEAQNEIIKTYGAETKIGLLASSFSAFANARRLRHECRQCAASP